jgi:DNA-binding beta-propeller fold protein YncE
VGGSWCRVRVGPAHVAMVPFAVCALTLALGAIPAHAIFLPLSHFGSPGSGAGQFQTPVGVAVDQASGAVYVADSGNARVEKFDASGNFIAAWGWGVTDGTAKSEVCTSTCQAGIAGSGPGQFSRPTSIAVDSSGGPSTGDVYVADAGTNVALKFDTNGNFLATINGSTTPQGGFSALVGVAVDQSGNFWTADANTDNITEFDPTGNFLQQWTDPFGTTLAIAVDATNGAVYLIRGIQTTERFTLTGGNETVIDGEGTGVALGLDPQTGNLYVDHSDHVSVWDPTGTQVDSITLTGTNSQGLAFGSSAGHLYVSDASADTVTIYGPPTTPGPPVVFSESATNVTGTGATLNATIVPFGLDTTCQFQFVNDASFKATGYTTATSVACTPADLGSSFTFVKASATLSGLTPVTIYHFRAVATNADGTTNGADMTFETPGPPTIVSESATNVLDTVATLNATVIPNGGDTTCQFQFVNDAAFQATGYSTATSVPCSPADLGSSFDPQNTSANVIGLTPDTTYHFRAVATSAGGTTTGADKTFHTLVSFLLQVSSFGSTGSGAGQFQTPVGVAIQLSSGVVYVADSGNARVENFTATGKFIAAFGWGVADGMAHSEVCTANCQAGIPGSGPGQFSLPTSIAFGNGSGGASVGKVYVGDAGNNVVLKFDASGNFLGTIDGSTTPQGHFVSLAGVAVDQSGNLWTADGGTANVDEFSPSGKFLQQWTDPSGSMQAIAVDATHNAVYLITFGTTARFTLTGGSETTIDGGAVGGSGRALALDPKTGNLYVDHGGDVAVYAPNGARIDTLFTLGAGSTTNSQGLAFHGGGGKPGQNELYVSDASNNTVTIYGPHSAGPPFITAESASITGRTTATLNAAVVPLGHDTTCTFQFVDDANFMATGYSTATTVACTPADLGASFTYQQASANISGLATPNVVYHFHVIATNSAGTTTGADTTFTTPPGDWGPFTRCPVDDPAMLAATGGTLGLFGGGTGSTDFCVTSNSTHGSITIGPLTTPTGNTNLQVGLVLDNTTGVFSTVAPAGGALIADPVAVLGGVVTATVESAGTPSNFNLFAGISLGQPIITVPIKIHLESQSLALGPNCFIGSDQNPIVLNPANTDLSNAMAKIEFFDPGGTPDPNGPLVTIVVSGAVQGDNTFAVPGATGCGANDSLDGTVDAVAGLPSPSGSNNLVLDDASSALAFPFNGENGQAFASQWHIAFGP